MTAWTFIQAKISGCDNELFISRSEFSASVTLSSSIQISILGHWKFPGWVGGEGVEMSKS